MTHQSEDRHDQFRGNPGLKNDVCSVGVKTNSSCYSDNFDAVKNPADDKNLFLLNHLFSPPETKSCSWSKTLKSTSQLAFGQRLCIYSSCTPIEPTETVLNARLKSSMVPERHHLFDASV